MLNLGYKINNTIRNNNNFFRDFVQLLCDKNDFCVHMTTKIEDVGKTLAASLTSIAVAGFSKLISFVIYFAAALPPSGLKSWDGAFKAYLP